MEDSLFHTYIGVASQLADAIETKQEKLLGRIEICLGIKQDHMLSPNRFVVATYKGLRAVEFNYMAAEKYVLSEVHSSHLGPRLLSTDLLTSLPSATSHRLICAEKPRPTLARAPPV